MNGPPCVHTAQRECAASTPRSLAGLPALSAAAHRSPGGASELASVPRSPEVQGCTEWLLNSNIQSESGGVYGWLDEQSGNGSFLYSEISGYAISTFIHLYLETGDMRFLARAESAAGWIVREALTECGGVRTRLYPNDDQADRLFSFSGGNLFAFDTGMVLNGLCHLASVTGDRELWVAAQRIGDFLVREMITPDGEVLPLINFEGSAPDVTGSSKWSLQSGSFQAKIAIGLALLGIQTGDTKYIEAAYRVCQSAMMHQQSDGRFVTDRTSGDTHLHAHCYSIEGLAVTGTLLGERRFVEAAERGARWALEKVSAEGIGETFLQATGTMSTFERSDVVAQVLRAGLMFGYTSKRDVLLAKLRDRQSESDIAAVPGGIRYSQQHEHRNFWCTAFALQAFQMAEASRQGAPTGIPEVMI